MDREVTVGEFAGAVLEGVDGVKLRALASRFDDERPEVDVGAENVGAPRDDQLRVAELFGFRGVAVARRVIHSGHAGGGTDGAVETRSTHAMEESAIHATKIEQAHRARVAVGKDGFRTVLIGGLLQMVRDFVEGVIPGDAGEAALAFGSDAAQRIEQAAGGIFVIEVTGDLAAKKSAGDRVVRVAA